ncbi:AraC family transcriptional regulator [Flexithrix dorotheae]|uniref:AraC family transcriptional regulator n=1 Tax=Flexithrix dorotheae TaxID=70993 RepID=UPI00037D5507|nr:AraC family transcriptional regulator [Flexithrix dorotheae]
MDFSARYIRNIIFFASRQGADFEVLLKTTGLTIEELGAEDLRLDEKIYNEVVEKAVALSKDDLFGLHLGDYLNLSAVGLVGQIAQTSKNIKEALQHICHFASLGCKALPMELSIGTNTFQLSLTPDIEWVKESPVAVEHTLMATIAFTLKEFQTLTLKKHHPLKIHFSTVKERKTGEITEILGAPILFGENENAIIFDKKYLHEPIISSDYRLHSILVEHANQKLAAQQVKSSDSALLKMIKDTIINLAQPALPSIEQVASNLNLTVRTLQRKLKQENQTFKALTEEIKKEFAISYLKRKDLNIGDIAFLLGYAEPSPFIRSFKKWTGKSPTSFRNEFVKDAGF